MRFLLLLTLSACRPPVVPPVPSESGDSTAPDSGHTDVPDTSTPPDPDETAETGSEVVPPGEADPVFSPEGGGFTESVLVELSSSVGEGDLWWCAVPPSGTCTWQPYEAPIDLARSVVLHARVDLRGVEGQAQARSYVVLRPDVAEFTSNLPVLVFWTDENAPTSDTRVAMGLDVFEPGDDGVTRLTTAANSGRCGLKVRGSSSAGQEKLPYDLELWDASSDTDRKDMLVGLPADGDWVLYAPWYYDEALIRNSLVYQLSNEVGRYAPRTRSVELYVSDGSRPVSADDYVGVYQVVEQVQVSEARVDITPLEPDDVALPEVTGGYLFKRDRAGDGERGFWSGEADGAFYFEYPLVWVDPSEDEVAPRQARYLEDELDDLAWALVADDLTSPDTGRRYDEIVDVPSWIDHHILNALPKNPDAFRLSGYLFKDREGPIQAGPLWDLDRTAGANDSRATDPYEWDASGWTSDTTPLFTFGWYGPMFDDPAFADAYWARWTELLAGPLSAEHVLEVLDAQAAELEEAGARDADRWGSGAFPVEIARLRTWYEGRVRWIADCIAAEPDPRDCR